MTTMSVTPRSKRSRPAILGQLPPVSRADGSPIRVLLVDDERALTNLVTMAIRYEGWTVEVAHNGKDAIRMFHAVSPDLVVLDIMLPDLDGLQILERLRAGAAAGVPVLFLTARDSVTDRVTGLTAGADDYMTKPFSLEELVARLHGLLRRAGNSTPPDDLLRVGDLELETASREVTRGGDRIDLTATEFELLQYLMRNPRRALDRDDILRHVWNYSFGGRTSIVDLYISYLRRKIDVGREPMIHTVRGIGYQLRPAT